MDERAVPAGEQSLRQKYKEKGREKGPGKGQLEGQEVVFKLRDVLFGFKYEREIGLLKGSEKLEATA